MIPATGDIVRVRSRQYLVEGVDPPPKSGDSTRVRLSCIEDDAQGEPLEVLWEREVDARLLRQTDWDRIASRGFDEPRLFSAYLHTLRWSCVTATDPKLFQAPYRAGIEVKAYQLQPLRMAIAMPRVNLFIADDVGLGKTIEAGLILRELTLRQKVRRVVICVPPSVVRQWRDEMEERFGLSFVIYDRDFVSQVRRERGYAVNPWKTHTRFILSHALVRDELYAAPLRDFLGEFSGGSLLILDEAHNVAPASGGRYAIDSKLTRALRDLAPRFEHKLFLSATPHNGHSNSFSALLELLDPQRFVRGVPVDAKLRDAVLVRRLKSDLRALGETFPERQIVRIEIDGLPEDAPALALSRLLEQYRRAREERLASAKKTQQAAAMLVVLSLQKRLLSSIEAFARTLDIHRAAVGKESAADSHLPPSHALDLLALSPDGDDDRADLPEEEVEAEADAQMQAASVVTSVTAQERALLIQMADIATRSRYDVDPRVAYLLSWIQKNQCPNLGQPDADWLPRRVIIFTEYADTKRYLQQVLGDAIRESLRGSERIATFHGGIGEDRREAIKSAWNADPQRHPIRILIATDAAREGVNLQNNCADLFHFDIPWNPSRIEQRNGRIDRKLQQSPIVRCMYFVLPQRAEDRVLDVIVSKTRKIHEELGSLAPIVGRRIDEALALGIAHDRIEDLTQALSQVDAPDPGDDAGDAKQPTDPGSASPVHGRARTLLFEMGHAESSARRERLDRQLRDLREQLKRSREWISLDDRHFRDALSASLETIGAEGLQPVDPAHAASDPARASWQLPKLHERRGADPSWAATLDTLRTPRKKGQSPAEWRRDAPIRPVVFRDPGNLNGDVVHLHLEHRVVQRLLGRFLSQGFRDDDLRRACVLRTVEAVPHVVLLGRLSLFGDGGARLHDEVLAAAAEWMPPEQRSGKSGLRAMGEEGKADVLRLIEDALAEPRLREAETPLQVRLRQHASRDVAELTPNLERRAAVLADRAARELGKRSDAEAADMAKILVSQRERIEQRQRQLDEESRQGRLAFDADEERQLADDRRYWQTRLSAIARELEGEPQRIRRSYQVRATRVEAVGLVYLWPLSS
mgnify:FL=1